MELGLCDASQLERMFLKFFDDASAAARFANEVDPDRWSPAQVQERLLKAESVDEALRLFREPVVAAAARAA
jgi:hypothetical protein